MTDERHIVNVSVEASVDGQDLFVTGATLTLAVNAIPTLELQCVPSKNGSKTALKPNVVKPTIGGYNEFYRDLSGKAETLETPCNATIKIMDQNRGRAELIEIKNWVLAGVGMSNVSAVAAPYLSVIMQHPICKLTKVGSIYETPKTSVNDKIDSAAASGENFLDIVTKVYECARNKVEYWTVTGDEESAQKARVFRDNLGVGDFSPSKWIVFKSGSSEDGIFLGRAAESYDGMKTRLAQAEGRIVFPSGSGSSTWDMLVGSCGQTLLSITQDQTNNFLTDQIVLEPTKPWKKYSVTLREEDCFWTDIPGVNPMRLVGVMSRKLGVYTDPVDLGLLRNGNVIKYEPTSSVLYSPVDRASVAGGRILKVEAPSLLDSAFRRDADYGIPITESKIDTAKARADGFNGVLMKYCKAVYEMTVGSMMMGRAQMALWTSEYETGNRILPGNTCRFVSDGKAIYYGYIQQVVHQMSTSGGCSTTINMNYVRPTEDFMIGDKTVIASGSPNAAYA